MAHSQTGGFYARTQKTWYVQRSFMRRTDRTWHLYVIVAEVGKNGNYLIMPLSTLRGDARKEEDICCIREGEASGVTSISCVRYDKSEIVSIYQLDAELGNRAIYKLAEFPREIVRRMNAGAWKSKYIASDFYKYLN